MLRAMILALLLLLIGGVAPSAQAQQEKSEMSPEAKAERAKHWAEINRNLDLLASDMARALAHPGFRGLVRAQIAKSKHREQILELETLLEGTMGNAAPPGLEKLKQSAAETGWRLRASAAAKRSAAEEAESGKRLPADGLDLYFPVPAHRGKWKGDSDLLVAFSPMDDEPETSEIVAYSVKNGKKVTLDSERAPEQPVLVIAAEEHPSHEAHSGPQADASLPADDPAPEASGNPAEARATPPAGVEGAEVSTRSGPVGGQLRYLKIYADQEPWYRGDPEIYLLWGVVSSRWCTERRSECPGVNQTNRWYDTGPKPLERKPGEGPCTTETLTDVSPRDGAWFRFAPPVEDKVVLYVMESDGGTQNRLLDNAWPGVTCEWDIKTGDDRVQLVWTYMSRFPAKYDYYHRVGDAYVVWHHW